MGSDAAAEIVIPKELPFLESLSWSDKAFRQLSPREMLQRYEAGWRHKGVLGEPSPAELDFIRSLIARFGSWLHV
jgi:hypothetical protein